MRSDRVILGVVACLGVCGALAGASSCSTPSACATAESASAPATRLCPSSMERTTRMSEKFSRLTYNPHPFVLFPKVLSGLQRDPWLLGPALGCSAHGPLRRCAYRNMSPIMAT